MSPDDLKAKLLAPISALGIKYTRLKSCLANENLVTVGEILALSESRLYRIPNFGRLTMNRLKDHLADFGLPLGSVKFTKERFFPQEETFEEFIVGATFDPDFAKPAQSVDKTIPKKQPDLMAA